jgi:hypothetical protein
VYKLQWTGSRVIAPGAIGIIKWTADSDCIDGNGNPTSWENKLYRKNDNVHKCGNLGQSEAVSTVPVFHRLERASFA